MRACRVANGGGPEKFSAAALKRLQQYAWPGNVRELRNVVHRASVLAEGATVFPLDLPSSLTGEGVADVEVAPASEGPTVVPAEGSGIESLALDVLIEEHIRRVLGVARGNKSRAAELLGIPRTSLYHKLRKYDIEYENPPE